LSGRGLCDELITRPEESYRLCCVVVCDLETSRIGAPCIYIYGISSLSVNYILVRTYILQADATFFAWRSWIRASWYNYENNQQDALYRLIYYSRSALHVSGDVFAHYQEHLTAFTVSGSVHPSWVENSSMTTADSNLGEHYQIM